MADKLALAFAAIEVMAKAGGVQGQDLADYLRHTSQHSDAFLNEIDAHVKNIEDYEAFQQNHRVETAPSGRATTYTQAELDARIATMLKEAIAERDKNANTLLMTPEQLNDLVAKRVKEELAKAKPQKGGDD